MSVLVPTVVLTLVAFTDFLTARNYMPSHFYKKSYLSRSGNVRGGISGYPSVPRGNWIYPTKYYPNMYQSSPSSNDIYTTLYSKYPGAAPESTGPASLSPNEVLNGPAWNDAFDWDHPLDPNVCRKLQGMTREQIKLCYRHPDATSAALIGLKMAVKECQKLLRGHRWNCTSLMAYEENPHQAPIMAKGFSETAFVHAITAAGVTQSVARACAAGKLTSCSCGMVKGKRAWKWSGCHDNTKFGARFSRMLLDVRERDRDVVSYTHLYNNELGRKVVRRNRKVHCKCHGMSGSCEMRTCWKEVPRFREVGMTLVKKLETVKAAAHTVFGNSARSLGTLKQLRRVISTDSPLLFSEQSPNFCRADDRLGLSSPRGRECQRGSNGPDSCQSLCCGRGFNVVRRKSIKQCHCHFKWCCHVVCSQCVQHQWVAICK